MELDHLFIVIPDRPGTKAAGRMGQYASVNSSRLRAALMAAAIHKVGILETFSRIHEGQGTANHRFQFDNVLLELLYVHLPEELSKPPTTALKLAARFFDTEASPFGICSRPYENADSDAPYPHAKYRPSYLPSGLAVQFADDLPATEPLWFHLPFADRPDESNAEDRAHPSGLRRVSAVRLETRQALSQRSMSIADQLQIEITKSDRDHMILQFEPPLPERGSGCLEPHPELPLSLCW